MTATVSSTQLLRRIREEFPDLSWTRYRHLSNGWDHAVIILDEKLVFRFPKSPEYLKVLKDEIELLRFLGGKLKTKIPQYEFVAADNSFAGYQLITGTELTEHVFAALSEQERRDAAGQLADFFTVLHTTDVRELEKYHVPYEKLVEYELKTLSEEYLKPNLGADEYRKVERIIAEFDEIDTRELPQALTHSDLSPKHILWNTEEHSVGIIDFSDRCIDDPALDFAELYTYGPEFVERVYDLYRGPKDSEFLERAKAYQRRVGVYMLVDHFRYKSPSFDEARRIFYKALAL